MKAEIKSVKIAIGGAEHELTLDEARALKAALEELFPQPRAVDFVSIPRPYPVPVWPEPYWRRPWVTWGGGDRSGRVQGRYDQTSGTVMLSVGEKG